LHQKRKKDDWWWLYYRLWLNNKIELYYTYTACIDPHAQTFYIALMLTHTNQSLQSLNSLGVPAYAKQLITIDSTQTLQTLLSQTLTDPHLILGGGNNILFTQDFFGLILHNQIKGIVVIKEDKDHAWIQAGAGELWHPFVQHCLSSGYYGLENLSLIPGTVGAAPVQNIGAYGVEVESYIDSITAFDLTNANIIRFKHSDCAFAYRSSLFKTTLKQSVFITEVLFKLPKHPQLKLNYGTIQTELDKRHIQHPTPQDVSDAVCAIRQRRLPNPTEIPNAGSFFKNPVIDLSKFETLQAQYPNIPYYTQPHQQIKIPAAWLIEQCGLKGFEKKGVSTYKNHALVITNPQHQPGQAIKVFAEYIQQQVQQKFAIKLIPEVNLI
jgi:UDP-N-acetylmuramate dehydrogenase